MIHQPVSVVSQCLLNAWLLGLLTEISVNLRLAGSALEVLRNDALYKFMYLIFFYFTQDANF